MRIEDLAQREALETAADQQGWNSRQLEQRVRPLLLAQKAVAVPVAGEAPAPSTARLLPPKRGTIGVHRLVPGAEGMAVDLGFTSFLELTSTQAEGFKAGEFVRKDSYAPRDWEGDGRGAPG